MAYEPFLNDKPSLSESGSLAITYTERNLQALRDGLALLGHMPDWDYSITVGTGTIRKPQYRHYKLGSDTNYQVRITETWTDVGGVDRVTQVLYQYTENNGTNWDTIGTKYISYSGAYITSTAWS